MRSQFILALMMVAFLNMNCTTASSVEAILLQSSEMGYLDWIKFTWNFTLRTDLINSGKVILVLAVGFTIFHFVAVTYQLIKESCKNRNEKHRIIFYNEGPYNAENSCPLLDLPSSLQTTQEDPSRSQENDGLLQVEPAVHLEIENELPAGTQAPRKVRKPLPPIRGMFQGPIFNPNM